LEDYKFESATQLTFYNRKVYSFVCDDRANFILLIEGKASSSNKSSPAKISSGKADMSIYVAANSMLRDMDNIISIIKTKDKLKKFKSATGRMHCSKNSSTYQNLTPNSKIMIP
jgi:hypothetical protein